MVERREETRAGVSIALDPNGLGGGRPRSHPFVLSLSKDE